MTGPANHKQFSVFSLQFAAILVRIIFVIAVCTLGFTQSARAATLIGVSSVSAIEHGTSVPIEWYLDTEGETINAIELGLAFSSTTLMLEAEPGRSLVSLWVERPTADNEQGLVVLVGGVPGGMSGIVPLFRTTVTGRATGPAVFALLSGSQVYVHDGSGTGVPLELSPFQLSVVEAKDAGIRSRTHPDQNVWYEENTVEITFPYEPEKKYNYTFTSDFNQFPTTEPKQTTGTASYEDLADGIYYFRLIEISAENTPQEKGVYRVQIDRTPPEPFTPVVATSTDLYVGAPFVSWSTVDKTSGIAAYRARSGFFGFWRSAVSPVEVRRPILGNMVYIRAYDSAGNYRDESFVFPGYLSLPLFFTLLLCGILGGAYMRYSLTKRALP